MELNEAKQILNDSGYICEEFVLTDGERRLETVGDLIDVLKELPRTFNIQIRNGNSEDFNIGMIAQSVDSNGNANKTIVLFQKKRVYND